MKVGGIALPSAIASTINFCTLFYLMGKRLGGLETGWINFLVRIILATAVTATVSSLLWGILTGHELIRLGLAAGIGFVVYAVVCYFLKIEQAQKTFSWFKEKFLKNQ